VASPTILICPTAYKGTLTASEATAALADGARRALPDAELWLQPLADGGNGLLNALESAGGGKGKGAQVAGPLGTSVTARFLVQEEQAVVETAEACGLHLVPETLRDPLRASTRGVGDLLMAAAKEVVPGGRLIVGLGGSATVDAGAGMAEALGWRLLDDGGEPIPPGGAGLLHLAAIEPPADRRALPPLVVLADVTNPLVGVQGAARVFGPQKGAGPEVVSRLDRGLEQWARVVERDVGRDVADLPGSGAAGGLGAAFAALLDATPLPGADWVLDEAGFDAALAGAAVVVTGEGSWDAQSSMGKATGEVVRRSRRAGVPVLLVAGRSSSKAPEGVRVVAGDGGVLGTRDLARLVAESLAGLLPPTGRP
jgi:glycerate 2-kinase